MRSALSGVRRTWVYSVLLAGASLGACGGDGRTAADAPAGATPEWLVDATPRLSVGDGAQVDSSVLARVSDARLLPSGVLAVADAGAFAVKFFGADGALIRSVGQRGSGPGEFRGAITLMDAPGDSVAVWDPGQTRWVFVSAAGGSRQLVDRLPLPVWLRAGIEVHSAVAAPPAWVMSLLDTLSASSPSLRVAHLDADAVLWVRQDPELRSWRAYAGSAVPVGTVTLPERYTALHFTSRAIVALESDSLGYERVAVLGLTRTAHAAAPREPLAQLADATAARGELMGAVRRAVMAQEMHYVKASAYTSEADSLELAMPEGTRFKVIEATARGWRGLGWYPATGMTCGMIVGLSTPAGWSEGEVVCTAFR